MLTDCSVNGVEITVVFTIESSLITGSAMNYGMHSESYIISFFHTEC